MSFSRPNTKRKTHTQKKKKKKILKEEIIPPPPPANRETRRRKRTENTFSFRDVWMITKRTRREAPLAAIFAARKRCARIKSKSTRARFHVWKSFTRSIVKGRKKERPFSASVFSSLSCALSPTRAIHPIFVRRRNDRVDVLFTKKTWNKTLTSRKRKQ